jgi:hypothetical protein
MPRNQESAARVVLAAHAFTATTRTAHERLAHALGDARQFPPARVWFAHLGVSNTTRSRLLQLQSSCVTPTLSCNLSALLNGGPATAPHVQAQLLCALTGDAPARRVAHACWCWLTQAAICVRDTKAVHRCVEQLLMAAARQDDPRVLDRLVGLLHRAGTLQAAGNARLNVLRHACTTLLQQVPFDNLLFLALLVQWRTMLLPQMVFVESKWPKTAATQVRWLCQHPDALHWILAGCTIAQNVQAQCVLLDGATRYLCAAQFQALLEDPSVYIDHSTAVQVLQLQAGTGTFSVNFATLLEWCHTHGCMQELGGLCVHAPSVIRQARLPAAEQPPCDPVRIFRRWKLLSPDCEVGWMLVLLARVGGGAPRWTLELDTCIRGLLLHAVHAYGKDWLCARLRTPELAEYVDLYSRAPELCQWLCTTFEAPACDVAALMLPGPAGDTHEAAGSTDAISSVLLSAGFCNVPPPTGVL